MQDNYMDKLEKIFEQSKKNIEKLCKECQKPLTESKLQKYKEKFIELTSIYNTQLLRLQGMVSGYNKIEVESEKLSFFLNEIFEQIRRIKQSRLMANEIAFNDLITNEINNFTKQEKKILELIYIDKREYSEIYEKCLGIHKRTFDDHLNRIADKLYKYFQDQKNKFPQYTHLFPEYPTKEKEDGSLTFSKPYTVIQNFLSRI